MDDTAFPLPLAPCWVLLSVFGDTLLEVVGAGTLSNASGNLPQMISGRTSNPPR